MNKSILIISLIKIFGVGIVRRAEHASFFHPDYTVGSGFAPDHAFAKNFAPARGLACIRRFRLSRLTADRELGH